MAGNFLIFFKTFYAPLMAVLFHSLTKKLYLCILVLYEI
jgi:hypothetical protein